MGVSTSEGKNFNLKQDLMVAMVGMEGALF